MPLESFNLKPVKKIKGADKVIDALNECLTYERAAVEGLFTMARELKTRKMKKLAAKVEGRAKSHKKALWSIVKRISHPLLAGEASMELAGLEWTGGGDTVSILQAALDLMRDAHDCYERAVVVTTDNGDSVSRHYHVLPNLKRVDREVMWFAAQLRLANEATVGEYQAEWMD